MMRSKFRGGSCRGIGSGNLFRRLCELKFADRFKVGRGMTRAFAEHMDRNLRVRERVVDKFRRGGRVERNFRRSRRNDIESVIEQFLAQTQIVLDRKSVVEG